MMAKLRIKNSHIHGQGVFANQAFQAGEVISTWSEHADILSQQEVEDLPSSEKEFIFVIDGRSVLFKGHARFINHSCDPNTKAVNGYDIAIRFIAEGEEITVDYNVENVGGQMHVCRCNASRCRGVMRGPALKSD